MTVHTPGAILPDRSVSIRTPFGFHKPIEGAAGIRTLGLGTVPAPGFYGLLCGHITAAFPGGASLDVPYLGRYAHQAMRPERFS
jgi:hypothetical protein